MDFRNSAIAIATDDSESVSSHFGRARYYEVLIFAEGKVVRRERREKAGHHAAGAHGPGGHAHGGQNGSHDGLHASMVAPVLDCRAVVARGMGEGAVEHIRRAHLTPILTGLQTIGEVIAAVEADTLTHDPRRVHQHHGQ